MSTPQKPQTVELGDSCAQISRIRDFFLSAADRWDGSGDLTLPFSRARRRRRPHFFR